MGSNGVNSGRRKFLTAATSLVGVAGAVGIAVPFIGSWNPSAKAKAAGAPVKADISKIEPGQMVVVEWRGKPVYVVNRTDAQLQELPNLNDRLKDPESTASVQPAYITGIDRAMRPNLLVIVGLCTHLGCAPKFRPEVGAPDLSTSGQEWEGGFFCPCHGSKFDLSGRVFKDVPAPLNLPVPPYQFVTDTRILIGAEQGAA